MRDRIRVRDFEPALLQIVAVIKNRAANEERAFWIDNYAHARSRDHDVAIGRAIDQIHFVLQPGTATTDDGDAQCALRPALFLEQRGETARGRLGHFHQTLVADLVVRRSSCFQS